VLCTYKNFATFVGLFRRYADGVIMADAQSWLKSSIVARIRGRLSFKLHAGISARVLKHLRAPTEDAGGIEVQVADQPGDHAD
jgi:hypothetical protein